VAVQVQLAVQQTGFKRVKRGYKPLRVENLVHHMRPQQDPSDPYFPFQWYLKNTGQNGGKAKLDLNVEAAWAQGVTGKNVTTAIMDDGESVLIILLFRDGPTSSFHRVRHRFVVGQKC
jgi:proprotein convertase subtilisin/kexin type 2